ncbi:MAG: ktrB [Clostridiales bacterium]|jgi:trk system potassium uptake protein TrkH|nr:ktrB [Clostridiales bacterium]
MFIKNNKFKINLKPGQTIILGFFVVITIGALLLALPIASADGKSVGLIDAFFTSTSAVCVTGLVVRNTLEQWTRFGEVVIILLIQFGGLGFMTFTTALYMLLKKRVTLKDRMLIQESFNQDNLSGMVRFVRKIIAGTIIVEGIGTMLLSLQFVPEYGLLDGLWKSIFHSISAFCNAGFDIIGNSSLIPYSGNILVNFTIMLLIIIGGIGFPVWWDIVTAVKKHITNKWSIKRCINKLTLHTKLALSITIFLIMLGAIFIFIVEFNNVATLGSLSLKEKILTALFQSVTSRTAGFNTLSLGDLTQASQFMMIILMFIGGSPSGTAGGIKTVTLGIVLLEVISAIRGKDRAEAFGKTIPQDAVKRGLAVIVISLVVLVSVTMMLSLTQQGSFMDSFYEATSAFGTVGVTLGLTPILTSFGKIVIMLTMFTGRLGPVTMALAFSIRRNRKKAHIKLPEEKVMVG